MIHESLPELAEAEASMDQILENNGVFDYESNYDLEDEVFSVSWQDASIFYEILVSKTGFDQQLALEGYSVRDCGFREQASAHFGVSHSSLLHTNLSAQYGMLKGLEDSDYQMKANL